MGTGKSGKVGNAGKMKRSRFTPGDVARLPLSDDDWVEVKRDLNTGDQKKLENAGLKDPVEVGGRIIYPVDWERHDLERALIFLTDWSFTRQDDKGREAPVPVNMDGLKALNPEDFNEVNRAILKHVVERNKEKNAEREARLEVEAGSQPTTMPPPPPEPDATTLSESEPTS